MNSERIVSKFGGIRPLAKILGIPASTVQNWIDRKNIPSKRVPVILKAGMDNGIDVSIHDFFPVKEKKTNSNHS